MLRSLISLAGGTAEPFHRFANVLIHAATSFKAKPEVALGRGAFLFCCQTVPLNCLLVILRHDLASFIKYAKIKLGLGFALLGSLAKPFDGLSVVLLNSLSCLVGHS